MLVHMTSFPSEESRMTTWDFIIALFVPFRQPCLTSRLLYDYAASFYNCDSTNVIGQF